MSSLTVTDVMDQGYRMDVIRIKIIDLCNEFNLSLISKVALLSFMLHELEHEAFKIVETS